MAADGVRFPDEMFEKPTIHLSDKILISDFEDSKKTKWWTFTTIYNWILNLFGLKDASNITGTSKTAWQTALSQNSFSDRLLVASNVNVFEIDTNGIYKTDATCSNIPGVNKVGILQVLIDESKKYLHYETRQDLYGTSLGTSGYTYGIVGDVTEIWVNHYSGTTWKAWEKITNPENEVGTDTTSIHKATNAEISALTDKSALVDGDNFLAENSENTNSKVKVLWSSIKSVLKTYFDGIYQASGTYGDMVLSGVQSVTGLKTFDNSKLAIKGSSTGVNTIASANGSTNGYIHTLPARTMTFAGTDEITVNIPYFHATVGSSGADYTTIKAAVDAGKYTLKIITNITETANIT
jgi:hypothetical protein